MYIAVIQPIEIWQGDAPLRNILRTVEQNPFSPFYIADHNFEDLWNPYDQDHTWQALQGKLDSSVLLKTDTPYPLQAMITQGPWLNQIGFEIADAYLKMINNQAIKDYALQLAQTLPRFYNGSIGMQARHINDFYREHHLRPLRDGPLSSMLDWYHIVSPAGIEAQPSFTREELLGTPCYQVQELPNGWITLQMYDEPLHYASPQAEQTIIAATQYLLAHQHYHNQYTP